MTSVLFVVGLLGLVWLGHRYEPHYASKDGHRFSCRVRPLVTEHQRYLDAQRTALDTRPSPMLLGTFGGRPTGSSSLATRWRDARAVVDMADDRVQLVTRVGPVRRPLAPARVVARSDAPQNRRWVYVIDTEPLRELRVPVSSRSVPVLNELVARSSGNPLAP